MPDVSSASIFPGITIDANGIRIPASALPHFDQNGFTNNVAALKFELINSSTMPMQRLNQNNAALTLPPVSQVLLQETLPILRLT